MKILITGGAGYLGSALTRNLIKKHKGNIQLLLEIKGATKEELKELKSQIDNIKINKIIKSKFGYHIKLEYSEKHDPREEIFKVITKLNWVLLEMSLKSDNLEDIFRKLTRKNLNQ